MGWEREYKVRVSDCNMCNQTKFSAIWDILQEAATEHAISFKMGRTEMDALGVFWVLSRMKLEVLKYPQYGDSVKVRTRPAGVDKLFFMREYEVFDMDGECIARGMSAWVLVDQNTGRVLRVSQKLPGLSFPYEDEALEKLPVAQETVETNKIRVEYCDLDINNHTNNTVYIRWAENALMNAEKIRSMEVNYLVQTVLGDELTAVRSCEEADSDTVEILNKDEKTVFRARVYCD